jgi:hypothetical protein
MEDILNILDELSDKKKETEPNENICRDCHEDLIIADNEYVCPFIHLLKNKKKIAEHDNLWKSICEQMNWKFYETVI